MQDKILCYLLYSDVFSYRAVNAFFLKHIYFTLNELESSHLIILKRESFYKTT